MSNLKTYIVGVFIRVYDKLVDAPLSLIAGLLSVYYKTVKSTWIVVDLKIPWPWIENWWTHHYSKTLASLIRFKWLAIKHKIQIFYNEGIPKYLTNTKYNTKYNLTHDVTPLSLNSQEETIFSGRCYFILKCFWKNIKYGFIR